MNRMKKLMRKGMARAYGAFDCDTDIIALHERRVLFFSVPKVANTSVKRAFQSIIPDVKEYLRYTEYQDINGSLFAVQEVREELVGRNILLCKHQVSRYAGYRKVAFVRNPYDRLVSCYTQKVEPFLGNADPFSRGTLKTLVKAGEYREDLSFRDFAAAVSRISDGDANRHFRSQHSFLIDRNGKMLPDELYFFENLEKGFERLRELTGDGELELPHLKKTRRRDFRDYYDVETYEMVRKRYARDFELFGYSDSPEE